MEWTLGETQETSVYAANLASLQARADTATPSATGPRPIEFMFKMVMRLVAATVGILGVLLCGAYLAACWYLVHTMITMDRKQTRLSATELGVPNAEELSFRTPDGIPLVGWFVPGVGDRVIVLVHGIYSNAWDGQAPDVARAYHDADFNVFLYDSRGQGRSEGTLGLGWLERQDVRAAVTLLLTRGFRAGRIGVHGTSYGTATALLAAAELPEIGAVVADSAFADVRDVMLGEMARRTGLSVRWTRPLMPGLGLIAKRRYGADLDEASPEQAMAAIAPRPVLLIHGEQDPIIPVESVYRLHAAAPGSTTIWALPGRQHTERVRLAPDYEKESPFRETFLAKVTGFFHDHL